MQAHYDVVILGGGLAGLTLARQLRQERPGLQVLVLEKRTHPAPEAAHKVGESSVEIGAHYFGQVLGLDPHMADRQLPKFGIRYFFDDGQNRDLRHRYELGPRRCPRVSSYQLDRGARSTSCSRRISGRAATSSIAPSPPTSSWATRTHRPLHPGRLAAPRDLPMGRRRAPAAAGS